VAEAFICDYVRTPIGRYGGALAPMRADDLAAVPLAAILERNLKLDATDIDEVWMGCANQAGEDNRNVARMAVLLAGLPETVPGVTVNRLCGSGMEAVASAARAIRSGDMQLAIPGRHPLGMSGARITGTAALELLITGQRYGLATMCVGVGQGVAILIERV